MKRFHLSQPTFFKEQVMAEEVFKTSIFHFHILDGPAVLRIIQALAYDFLPCNQLVLGSEQSA